MAVAPYDEINKWIFLQYYREGFSAAAALAQYPGYFYDVVVIGRSAEDLDCVLWDIAAYIKTCSTTTAGGALPA